MARRPSFDYRKTPKGWLLNIPGSLSETGKLQRRYFATRDKAKEAAEILRAQYSKHGSSSAMLPPRTADDAVHALELLKSFNVSLTDAARFYATHHDRQAKAPTLTEAWDKALLVRRNHRPRTLANLRSWKKALPAWFMGMNVAAIKGEQIELALDEITTTRPRWETGFRWVRAVLGDCVKAGHFPANPASSIHRERPPETNDEVSIYTPEMLRGLFKSCRDYTDGIDRACASCVAPFAIMAFAGIRPEEVGKLRWEDIDLELRNIRIGSATAKKAQRRNVRIRPTLEAWLATIPEEDRIGKIVPPRWRFKASRVRREAGLDGRELQDALRHSFGSYTLAVEGDMAALQADMGHSHMAVFFAHYHNAMTKREALPYWDVLPVDVEIPKLESVA